jgi:hypothetical protein
LKLFWRGWRPRIWLCFLVKRIVLSLSKTIKVFYSTLLLAALFTAAWIYVWLNMGKHGYGKDNDRGQE